MILLKTNANAAAGSEDADNLLSRHNEERKKIYIYIYIFLPKAKVVRNYVLALSFERTATTFIRPSRSRPLCESHSLFVFVSLKRVQNPGRTPVEETLHGFCVLLITFCYFRPQTINNFNQFGSKKKTKKQKNKKQKRSSPESLMAEKIMT